MIKIIQTIILSILLITGITAATVDMTFHTKFEKTSTNELNISGMTIKKYIREVKFEQNNLKFDDEYDYDDAYKEYRKTRKFDAEYDVPEDLYHFKKNYVVNERQDYIRENRENNQHKINYFKQNNLKFHSTENHIRNDY